MLWMTKRKLQSNNPTKRYRAVQELVGRTGPEAFELLLMAQQDQDEEVRRASWDALREKCTQRMQSVLKKCSTDPRWQIRMATARLVAHSVWARHLTIEAEISKRLKHEDDSRSVPDLFMLMNDDRAICKSVGHAAAEALLSLGRHELGTEKHIWLDLNNKCPFDDVRHAAAEALLSLGRHEPVTAKHNWKDLYSKSPFEDVSVSAFKKLVEVGEFSRADVVSALADRRIKVRAAAAHLIGISFAKDAAVLSGLGIDRCEVEKGTVLELARRSLRGLLSPRKSAIHDDAIEAAAALAKLGDPQGVKYLLGCLSGWSSFPTLSRECQSTPREALEQVAGNYVNLILEAFQIASLDRQPPGHAHELKSRRREYLPGVQRLRVILADVITKVSKQLAEPLIAVIQATDLGEGGYFYYEAGESSKGDPYVSHAEIKRNAIQQLACLITNARVSNAVLLQITSLRDPQNVDEQELGRLREMVKQKLTYEAGGSPNARTPIAEQKLSLKHSVAGEELNSTSLADLLRKCYPERKASDDKTVSELLIQLVDAGYDSISSLQSELIGSEDAPRYSDILEEYEKTHFNLYDVGAVRMVLTIRQRRRENEFIGESFLPTQRAIR
jgi:HEAT repeat protein